MFTKPATSHATVTLRTMVLLLDALAHDMELCDLSTLDRIATTASQLAQDIRMSDDMLRAQMDEYEALIADKLMAESDALDHMGA